MVLCFLNSVVFVNFLLSDSQLISWEHLSLYTQLCQLVDTTLLPNEQGSNN